MIPFDKFKEEADKIPYQYRHSHFLYALVKWLRPTTVVEVGTHLGMSAVWMARALQENGEPSLLHCIDNFCWPEHANSDPQGVWWKNIRDCGVGDYVSLRVGRSIEVFWPPRIDMAYIDGNHSQKGCQADLDRALAHGATCICLNDTATCAGVQKVADRFRREGALMWDFIEVPFDAGLLVAVMRRGRPEPTQGDYDDWDRETDGYPYNKSE